MRFDLKKFQETSQLAGLLLCVFAAAVTLSYVLYYQSKAARIRLDPPAASLDIAPVSFDGMGAGSSDAEYMAAARQWESERIATRARRKQQEKETCGIVYESGRNHYVDELNWGLQEIPTDQVHLRAPLIRQLEQAEQDAGDER